MKHLFCSILLLLFQWTKQAKKKKEQKSYDDDEYSIVAPPKRVSYKAKQKHTNPNNKADEERRYSPRE